MSEPPSVVPTVKYFSVTPTPAVHWKSWLEPASVELFAGLVIAEGAPRTLILTLGGEDVVDLALAGGALEDGALRALPEVRGVRPVAGGYALTVGQVHVALPGVLDLVKARACTLERLSTRHATLEDVFVNLTGRQLRD